MNKMRFFNLLVAAALAAVAGLTARQAVALARVAPPEARRASQYPDCPFSTAELAALRAVYVTAPAGVALGPNSGLLGREGGLAMLQECGPLATYSLPEPD